MTHSHPRPRRPRRARVALTAGVACAALLLAACSGTASDDDPSGSAGSGGSGPAFELTTDTPDPVGDVDSFSWSLYAEPLSLSFAYAFDYPPNQVLANVCESLLRWNADLSYSPGLATEWSNPDPTTWVYQIRQGVTFHDGTSMTADDVVASLNYHLNPEVGSYWASVYRNVESIERTGDFEVTVKLTQPDSQWNQYMAVTPGTVESAQTLAAAGAEYGNPSTGVNCTGPFSFGSWQPGQGITLTRNEDYWDPELRAKSAEVQFVFLQDPSTRINAWQTGEVDGGWGVPANGYAQLQSGGPGTMFFGTNTTVTSQIVNDLEGPLGDVRVRQALLMAIDREGIVKAGEKGVGEVAEALTTRSVWVGVPESDVESYFSGLPQYPYDPEKAKALATEAGVAGQEIVIATSPVASSADVVAQATAEAAKLIGLVPEIRTISPDIYTTLFSDPAAREGIDLFFTAWYVSLGDPMEMYGVLRTGEFSNYGQWSDPQFDATVEEALITYDTTERATHSGQAQRIAQEQLPWLPLYTAPTSLWLGEAITGVAPSINYMYFPWAATIGAAS